MYLCMFVFTHELIETSVSLKATTATAKPPITTAGISKYAHTCMYVIHYVS